MLFRKLQMILILGLFGLALAACGDSDTDKSQSMTQDSMSKNMDGGDSGATLKAYDPDVPSMVVEDNNVVQQKEIYENWPE